LFAIPRKANGAYLLPFPEHGASMCGGIVSVKWFLCIEFPGLIDWHGGWYVPVVIGK